VSGQRIVQLVVSFVVITVIALLSERSRFATSIAAAMPVNLALALWFVFTATGGDRALTADFARNALLALIPTAIFLVACWYALGRGWSIGWTMTFGYGVWAVAVAVYWAAENRLVR
jgi:uncharacterized membrane protein (GlpM family)